MLDKFVQAMIDGSFHQRLEARSSAVSSTSWEREKALPLAGSETASFPNVSRGHNLRAIVVQDRLTRCDSESVGGAIALDSANPRRSEPCSRRAQRQGAGLWRIRTPVFASQEDAGVAAASDRLCREVTRPSPRNRVRPSAEPSAAGTSLPSHSATSSQQFPCQRDHHGFARTWLSRPASVVSPRGETAPQSTRTDAMGGRQQPCGPPRRERPDGAPP
jgi:hypothetical protein